ncbi:MAG: class I SAM-dependent methyltransferase [Planctomycetota bacterium]
MSEAGTWDRLAGRYDRIVGAFDQSYPELRALLQRDFAGREHVLEVAAGTGQFSLDLAAVVGRLTATDVSPEMVRRLEARVAERGVANATARCMSAYALEVEGAAPDGIVCANALHVMESPRRALAEFRRALRPGGRLAVPTFCHGIDWRRRLLSRLMSLVSPFRAYTRFSPESLRAMVAEAGFATREPVLLPGRFPIAYVVGDLPG